MYEKVYQTLTRLVGPSVGGRVEVLNVVVSLPANWPSTSTTKSPFM